MEKFLRRILKVGQPSSVSQGERIVPYEELNFSSGSMGLIKEVILGHASALTGEAVHLLSIEHGDDFVISRSEVPVR